MWPTPKIASLGTIWGGWLILILDRWLKLFFPQPTLTPIANWRIGLVVLLLIFLWLSLAGVTSAKNPLVLLTLGISSNLFDYLKSGAIIDYLKIGTIIINLADQLIIVGAVWLFLANFRDLFHNH